MFLTLCTNYFIRHILLPDQTWGNATISIKKDQLEEDIHKYNAIFIGASTTYKQLIPTTFDRIVTDADIRSFNLGSQSTMPPETFHIYDNILKLDGLDIEYAFIDLAKIDPCHTEHLHTTRKRYWYSPISYIFTLNVINNSLLPDTLKMLAIKNHTISFAENIFNIGLVTALDNIKRTKWNLSDEDLEGILGENYDGFVGLYEDAPGMIRRRELFLRDTNSVDRKEKKIQKLYNGNINSNLLNYAYLDKVNSLIEESKEKGIHLVFFLQPRMQLSQYRELIPLYNLIDEVHRIDLANPNLYPEFYNAKYMFDASHLNPEGAEIFSKYFAQEFNKLLIKKNS